MSLKIDPTTPKNANYEATIITRVITMIVIARNGKLVFTFFVIRKVRAIKLCGSVDKNDSNLYIFTH